MEESRAGLENVILKALAFYNGFLEKKDRIKIEDDMYLDERSGMSKLDFEAIVLLTLGYYERCFGINVDINCYDKEVLEQNTVEKLSYYLYLKIYSLIEGQRSVDDWIYH